MRCAVISDVHSNLEALSTVFSEIERLGIKDVYSSGDIIGYGPFPEQCVDMFIRKKVTSVLGNHDFVAINANSANDMNNFAAEAIKKNLTELTPLTRDFFLHIKPEETIDDMLFVHARPPNDMDLYLYKAEDAFELFDKFDERFCFVGHSHRPLILKFDSVNEYSDSIKAKKVKENIFYHHKNMLITEFRTTIIPLEKGSRYLINPGSVGQPRNHDKRASFVVMNDDYLGIKRLEYDIDKTVAAMKERGYPEFLYKRLKKGK